MYAPAMPWLQRWVLGESVGCYKLEDVCLQVASIHVNSWVQQHTRVTHGWGYRDRQIPKSCWTAAILAEFS